MSYISSFDSQALLTLKSCQLTPPKRLTVFHQYLSNVCPCQYSELGKKPQLILHYFKILSYKLCQFKNCFTTTSSFFAVQTANFRKQIPEYTSSCLCLCVQCCYIILFTVGVFGNNWLFFPIWKGKVQIIVLLVLIKSKSD